MKLLRTLTLLPLSMACHTPAPPRCTDCDIELQPLAQISDAFDPGVLPDRPIFASHDSRGRIFVIARNAEQLLVFNDSGRYLTRIGQAGGGPGEFRRIRRALVGPGDSLFLSDWGAGRVSVYGPDLTLVRTQQVSHSPAVVLPDSRLVTGERIGTGARADYPLHLLDSTGNAAGAFGPEEMPVMGLSNQLTRRLVAPARNGDVWTIPVGRYTLERWDPRTLQLKQHLAIPSTWFHDTEAYPSDDRIMPPAVVETVWEDADGLVWLVVRDPDTEWQPPARANQERAVSEEEYDALFDWVIEVVDPVAGSVIASKRFKKVLWGRPPGDLLVSREPDDPKGNSVFKVWRAVLRRK